MLILGIETSCDETAASILRKEKDEIKILSNIIASSQDLHTKTGGIIPEVAAREQVKLIIPIISNSLKTAGVKKEDIDALAVTVGPGLIGSLLVGTETTKALAYVWDKPIIPVNHLLAHIYGAWLNNSIPEFPVIGVVVSGGHTDIILMKNHNVIKWLGGTRDDAAGEAFDKTARLLNLPYPGGPQIAKKAALHRRYNSTKLNLFPRPLKNKDTLDTSFSGLKTAVLKEIKKEKLDEEIYVCHMAAEIEEAIVDSLIAKTLLAVKKYKPKSLVVAGGVASNKHLQSKLKKLQSSGLLGAGLHVPQQSATTDNAAMIAARAFFVSPIPWQKIKAEPNLPVTQIPSLTFSTD